MPNILVKVPRGYSSANTSANLLHEIANATAVSVKISPSSILRKTTWIVIDEVEPGRISVACDDMSFNNVPCVAIVYIPKEVLDDVALETYVMLLHKALVTCFPVGETRKLATSIILNNATDGTCSANGDVWHLVDLINPGQH